MGADQYHEPPGELSQEARTFARVSASLTEEAEAIGWYHQRLDVEKDPDARGVMEHALREECRHLCMDLEFLMRQLEPLREAGQEILFVPGKIGGGDESEGPGEGESSSAEGSSTTRTSWRL